MQLKHTILTIAIGLFYSTQVSSQSTSGNQLSDQKTEVTDFKYFIRTSYYGFTNWNSIGITPNIYFYELHMGKELNSKSKVGLKMARVKPFQPLGIQAWDLDLNSDSEWFDGRIEEYGIGAFYQRTLWKRLYASVEAVPYLKVFLDQNDQKIENGFRFYMSYHLGYHIPLFKNRMFIEPQIHCNYWPINSKGPTGFREQVEKHDNYFLFEPNIYIGINFN